jgi:hypothetical protein
MVCPVPVSEVKSNRGAGGFDLEKQRYLTRKLAQCFVHLWRSYLDVSTDC